MAEDTKQRRQQAILEILRRHGGAQPSGMVTEALATAGHDVSERTVRLYLAEMDAAGLTTNHGRRGRRITQKGASELHASSAMDRVGFLSAKIDEMTYAMDFDLATRAGTVVVNTAVVSRRDLETCLDEVMQVFAKGFAMGDLMALLPPGDSQGDIEVPEGMVGLTTVCSITLNGVLLKHGVPTHSRFGGLLEVKDGQAVRFVEMIQYDGTSIDPLAVFIHSAMTDYLGAIRTGNGRIGASFREIPAGSRSLVLSLADKLKVIGLGGFMEVGPAGRELLGIRVSPGRAGAVLIGGLNPVAVFEESGIRVMSRALSGLIEFNRLFHYGELPERLAGI